MEHTKVGEHSSFQHKFPSAETTSSPELIIYDSQATHVPSSGLSCITDEQKLKCKVFHRNRLWLYVFLWLDELSILQIATCLTLHGQRLSWISTDTLDMKPTTATEPCL